MDIPRDSMSSIGYLTNYAGRLLVRALERRLDGKSAGPMPVFLALTAGAAQPQKELARLAAVEQPTMANTLARMERDGLIAGEPDPNDRRSTLLRLTRLGKARADAALLAAGKVNALAFSALKPAERPVLIDMLKRIIATLEGDA